MPDSLPPASPDATPEPLPPIPVPPFPDPAPIRLIPLAEIEAGALTRDRTGLDQEPLTELQLSIAANGLRQPNEIFPLAAPCDGMAYGLLSGYRRLYAFRNLLEQTRQPRYAQIPAFVRERQDLAKSMAAMVEENEIRAGISPYERGLICVYARDQGAFGSIEQAVDGLFPNATRHKRTRLRDIAHFAAEIGGFFSAPEKLTERQIERITRIMGGDFGTLVRTALEESSITDPDHQWKLVQPILDEAEEHARRPQVGRGPGRPRRVLRPRYGVTIRRERTRDGWSLHVTGREATGPLIDLVLDEIERMYAPA
jgi:ParB family chromosome partitioning protein